VCDEFGEFCLVVGGHLLACLLTRCLLGHLLRLVRLSFESLALIAADIRLFGIEWTDSQDRASLASWTRRRSRLHVRMGLATPATTGAGTVSPFTRR
jgi:hypothetical protein